MLGKYVSKYLSQYYSVIELTRKDINAESETLESLLEKFKSISVNKGDIMINCIGTIKPRVDELGDLNAIMVNSVFPRLLSKTSKIIGINLIHPTTDCIYSGLRGDYIEKDKCDVNDVYGLSKALGEPNDCTVIRTSIIGEEVLQKRSLIEWVKSNRNNTVFGFTNHIWNGITTLQFAKVCQKIINKHYYWNGTRHIFSNKITKKDLVEQISNVYELHITVSPKETEIKCDRSLATEYPSNLDWFEIPSLEAQLQELKDFSKTLYR